MQSTGMRVHLPSFDGVKEWLTKDIQRIKDELLTSVLYRSFLKKEEIECININSTAHKRSLLFNFIGLPVEKRTKKRVPSVDKEFMKKHEDTHPIVGLLLQWSKHQKLKSAFVDSIPKLALPEGDGIHAVLHPDWRIGGAATWRLSCALPNLQNIPKVRELRRVFVPRTGRRFVEADLSQAEYRILASVTEEPAMMKAFLEGGDVHAETAKEFLGKRVITDEERQKGKTLNFSIIYGTTAQGLAKKWNITTERAQSLLDTFLAKFEKVSAWMEAQHERVRTDGYVESPFGKQRHLSVTGDEMADAHVYRQAGNHPIQSAAAEITLEAMVRLDRMKRWQIVAQVHDSLLVEVPEAEVSEAIATIKATLEDRSSIPWMKVPLVADVKVGHTWGDMEKV